MSQMIEIDLRPDEKTLRQFGFIAFFGFGFLAALAWFEWLIFSFGLGEARPLVAGALAALAVVSALLSLVYPKANWPIYVGLTLLAFPIGFVLSYVILGTLFYGMITPVGFVMRLIGRDPMHRGFDREATSYWVTVAGERPKASYFKQF